MKKRRQFSPEVKYSILQEAAREWITETSRKYNLAHSVLHYWKKKYLANGKEGLKASYRKVEALRCFYYNSAKLFSQLKMCRADESYLKWINRLEKQDLLIMDDFGLQSLDQENRLMLLEVIEDRHGRRSTIVTSQLPVIKWHELFGEQPIADAVLDRIVHTAHRLELKGESMRKIKSSIKQKNPVS